MLQKEQKGKKLVKLTSAGPQSGHSVDLVGQRVDMAGAEIQLADADVVSLHRGSRRHYGLIVSAIWGMCNTGYLVLSCLAVCQYVVSSTKKVWGRLDYRRKKEVGLRRYTKRTKDKTTPALTF